MKYDFYKHSRTGVIISVSAGLPVGGLWVKIAEGVKGNWTPESEEVPESVVIEEVVIEPQAEESPVEGLDWLFDGEPNSFSTYKELVASASRDFPARVGEVCYKFNGRSWVKVV